MTLPWQRFPPVALPTPVLALAAGPGGLWAGGLGGVARFTAGEGWAPARIDPFPRTVTALVQWEGGLLTGGEGAIWRSRDGGRTWRRSLTPSGCGMVTALALSPRFAEEGTALAATLRDGILRSSDGGRTWQTASFGLPSTEVLALAWGAGETVLAATAAGLARSPNGGRAWRALAAAGQPMVALAALPDGEVLAAPETGPLQQSAGNLVAWSPCGGLPDDLRITAVAANETCFLVGTVDHGIMRAVDGGTTWSAVSPARALCFASDGDCLFAGTDGGMLQSRDGGLTWDPLPPAPLHDYRQLLVGDGVPLLAGTHSLPITPGADGAWSELAAVPLPLTALQMAPGGALLASTPEGLFRSNDRGLSWEPVVSGASGRLTNLTFTGDGRGWAGATADGALLRTGDGGRTWAALVSPFGVLPLVALQAISGGVDRQAASLIAATYDERRRAVTVWRSDDDGERWTRGGDSYTDWPVVVTSGTPPLLTIGNVVTIRQPDGAWRQSTVGESGILRVASDRATMAALAGDGLWASPDLGVTWARDDAELPAAPKIDIALAGERLYVLLAGGQLWWRPR